MFIVVCFFSCCSRALRVLLSFPTRRSSDLVDHRQRSVDSRRAAPEPQADDRDPWAALAGDRKSTRLNSSHVSMSYAVFCLKKKKTPLSSTAMKDSLGGLSTTKRTTSRSQYQ